MNKYVPAFLGFLASAPLCAQFDISQVQYWIGSGADTSLLVVDFQDGSATPAYAWGYLHNGGTGADMVDAIAAADPAFSVEFVSGFLNSVFYGTHAGIGGAPNYWSTWSGTSIATFATNNGLAEPLGNGDWIGCSYTDFNPALPPSEPVPAAMPTAIAENSTAIALLIYPQPATDVLHVKADLPKWSPVRIFNTLGELVQEDRIMGGTTAINIGSLSSGLYILQAGNTKRTVIIQ